MSTPIESFLVALGFEVDSKDVSNFTEELDDAKKMMMGVVAAAGVAAVAVGAFVTVIAASVDELADFAAVEEVAVGTLSELGHAAQLTGSSLEAVKSTVGGLNKVIGEAVLGLGRGAMTFQKLGLNAKNADGSVKSFDQILNEVSDKMQGMSRQESIAMAEKLGIDRSLIPLLISGRDNIAALRLEAQELGAVTDEQAEAAGKYTDSFDRTVFMLKSMARTIAVELMPTLTMMMDGFRKWYLQNREIILSGIGKFLSYLTAILGILWDWTQRVISGFLVFFDWLTKSTIGIGLLVAALSILTKLAVYKAIGLIAAGLKVLVGSITLFNAAMLVTTILVGGVFLALGFLVDEIINFREGNESFIGDMVAKYPVLGEIINTIVETIKSAYDWMMGMWAVLQPAFMNIVQAVMNLVVAFAPVLSVIWQIASTILGFLLPIIGKTIMLILNMVAAIIEVVALISADLISNIAAVINFIANLITGAFGLVERFITGVFDRLFGLVDGFLSGVRTAVSFVGKLLGIDSVANTVARAGAGGAGQSVSSAPEAYRPFAQQARTPIGVAGTPRTGSGGSSVVTIAPQVSAPINITTNDPQAAAKAVQDTLDAKTRTATRNAQSAVKL